MTDHPSPAAPSGAPEGADPSMEEILASIRRILNEEEGAAGGEVQAADKAPAEDEILVLDRSMLVSVPEQQSQLPAPEPDPVVEEPSPMIPPIIPTATPTSVNGPDAGPGAVAPPSAGSPPSSQSLIAPETAAATASAIDSLLRTLANSRATQVYRGGPTIEDLVREEIRPLLATWLDTNLPPLVERLVRTEIERVVGRSIP
jgi:cell pole-organizing protein PopZ